jgi:hypothetical protein
MRESARRRIVQNPLQRLLARVRGHSSNLAELPGHVRIQPLVLLCLSFLAITSNQPGSAQTLSLASNQATAQKPGTAVIRGRVVARDTGLPIRRAQVRVTQDGAPEPGPLVASDDSGRYESNPVAPGQYTVSVEKTGYMRTAHGQRQPDDDGRLVTITAGQVLEGVDVALFKGGTIVVEVTDDLGGPFAKAQVALEQNEPIFRDARLMPRVVADTDEFGRVRFSELRAGDYYVLANPHASRRVALAANNGERILASTHYPGTTSVADALTVRVAAGQEVSVSVRLAAVSTFTVSGVAYAPNGEPLTGNLFLRRRPQTSQRDHDVTLQSGGQFTFAGVVPGKYEIYANGRDPAWVSLPIDVDANVAGVVVKTSRGATVRGRIVFDTGTRPNMPLTRFAVRVPASWGTVRRQGQFTVQDDGRFELAGIFGRSVLRALPALESAGWFLKSVSLDGKDITDTVLDLTTGEIGPVEVTFTQKRSELSGTILNAQGTATSDVVAVIFPERPELRTLQTRLIAVGRPDQQGRFTVMGLPPGGYLAATVESLATNQEWDIEWLRRLEVGAERFTLEENEQKTIRLRSR